MFNHQKGFVLREFVMMFIMVAAIVFTVFAFTSEPKQKTFERVQYSDIIQQISSDSIQKVIKNEGSQTITAIPKEVSKLPMVAIYPLDDQTLSEELLTHKIEFAIVPVEKSGFWVFFISWLPFIIIIGLWVWFARRQSASGSNGVASFGKNKSKSFSAGEIKVKFSDVAGIDESKEEVSEIVDFLLDKERFLKVGGKIPRGILMVGGPGTGKTLLAKSIAGEANVPFFSASGSDFVEMFVGVGAARVRDLFNEAKKNAPCVVFIDEIDAVGRKRGVGVGGGSDEREQTLNQLLVEMDGFEGNEGVIVIAATNRPDVLDNALLRPGRFDRQVHVPLPDVKGREQILKVHVRTVSIDESVDLSIVARGTPGFSGADLANLINEAALMAARLRKDVVTMADFEKAKDKILMGAERRTMIMKDEEKRLTAYHEAGHAIIGFLTPGHDPVHKVSIIPRGRALGVTMYLPDEDKVSYSKEMLVGQLKSLYGGRIAEELIFGKEKVTTGASNDIQRATQLAINMVKRWGFSDDVGPLSFIDEQSANSYLGMDSGERHTSEKTAESLDNAVKKIITDSYDTALNVLTDNVDKLHTMANALLKYETIDKDQVEKIMNGEMV